VVGVKARLSSISKGFCCEAGLLDFVITFEDSVVVYRYTRHHRFYQFEAFRIGEAFTLVVILHQTLMLISLRDNDDTTNSA
jgi:hypothetical protein